MSTPAPVVGNYYVLCGGHLLNNRRRYIPSGTLVRAVQAPKPGYTYWRVAVQVRKGAFSPGWLEVLARDLREISAVEIVAGVGLKIHRRRADKVKR